MAYGLLLLNLQKRSDNGVHQSYKKCTKNCAASVHQHSLDGCVDFWMGAENVHDEWSWRCDFCWESWLLKEPQYVDCVKSLPRPLPPATIAEPTKDEEMDEQHLSMLRKFE
ncbi:reverse transcriptase domain-containing protein [Tanacetum coccineum]